MKRRMLAGVILCLGFCFAFAEAPDEARSNAGQAQVALQRSKRVLDAYLLRLDPVTGLLPRRGGDEFAESFQTFCGT